MWDSAPFLLVVFLRQPSTGVDKFYGRAIGSLKENLCQYRLPRTVGTGAPPLQQDSVDPHLYRRTSNIHKQVWLSLLWGPCSIPLGLVAHKGLFLSYKCPFPPVLCMFWNQMTLTFKVRFSHHSQYISWIQRLENLMWSLEPLQKCEKFFHIIVLQFVGHLLWQVWDFILTCLFPPTILLQLLLCPWMWDICFFFFFLIWWVPASSCQWLFNS